MVSYFAPRGRFLIKAGNIRQAQKHQQQLQQQQQSQGKWPVLRHFRQSFSTKAANETETRTSNNLITKRLPNNNQLPPQQQQHRGWQKQQQQNQEQRTVLWRKWTGFFLRWAPVGFCIFGAIEWQAHKRKCEKREVPRTASQFQARIYCSLPLRILSRCFGWLASCYIPESLRPYVYGWYSSKFGVNIEEALYPDYKHYSSLSQFFTRPLREGVRVIDHASPLVSPADGRVLHFGSATNSLIEQVKGVNYSIEAFLGPPTWKQAEGKKSVAHNSAEYADMIKEHHCDNSSALYQCVIYLAPGDYHRFHSPAEWQAQVRRHFAGELLSVNPKIAAWLPELFCLNERAVYMGKWKYGFFSYTAVGATNVGSVQIFADESLKTNRWVGLRKKRGHYDELKLTKQLNYRKGELVGQFNMGSTIVLLFEAPKNFVFDIEAGQKIRVGERLGHVEENVK